MALIDTIRNKLQSAVFNKLGSTLTINQVSSSSVDKWGDSTITLGSNQSTQAVPFNYVYKQLSYQPFGDLGSGQLDIVVPYGTTLEKNTSVTYSSDTWRVTNIEDFIISGGSVAKVARLERNFA